MVRKDPAVYLFIGEDRTSKEINIQKIKSLYLTSGTEHFNLDVLYAREVNLSLLQECVLALPAQSKKRVVIIKQAQELKPNIKDFISQYAQSGDGRTVIILDMERGDIKGQFITDIGKWGQVMRFKESVKVNTFTLARLIEDRKSVV
jgi:DNA polymerase III delta subunit